MKEDCSRYYGTVYLRFPFDCAVCMQAMTHSVQNVPSQQAVELLVLGLGFVEQCWLRLFLGDQRQLHMG